MIPSQSRQLHETGFRHIGNKERHLRNIYKTGEKKKRDADEEKREIDRLEKVSFDPSMAPLQGQTPSRPTSRAMALARLQGDASICLFDANISCSV